jgi:hypothetical protein
VERASTCPVVKPSWLLAIRCSEPPDPVARQVLEVEGLRHDALPGEGRVAVDLHGERPTHVDVDRRARSADGLERPRAADHDRVDELEVRRVRQQRELDLPSLAAADVDRAGGLRAEVVLDVALTARRQVDVDVGRPLALELGDDLGVGPAQHVGQHVQPPAVRHAEDRVADAVAGGQRDRLVEHQDHHLEALDRELLRSQEGAAQVGLEALDAQQPDQELAVLLGFRLDPEGP